MNAYQEIEMMRNGKGVYYYAPAPAIGALGLAPLIIAGIAVVSAGSLGLIANKIIGNWRSGTTAPEKTRQDAQKLLEASLKMRAEGKITKEEYTRIVDTVKSSLPSNLTTGGAGAFFSKYGTTIIIGMVTIISASLILKAIGGR